MQGNTAMCLQEKSTTQGFFSLQNPFRCMKKQAPVTLRCLLPSGESNREAGPPAGPAGQSPTHIPPGPGGLAKGSYRHPLKPCPQPTRCFLRSPPGHRCLRLSTHPDQGFSYPPPRPRRLGRTLRSQISCLPSHTVNLSSPP